MYTIRNFRFSQVVFYFENGGSRFLQNVDTYLPTTIITSCKSVIYALYKMKINYSTTDKIFWFRVCTQCVSRVPTQGTVGRESILGTVHQSVTRNGVSTRAKKTA
jgi:hypothetical protein